MMQVQSIDWSAQTNIMPSFNIDNVCHHFTDSWDIRWGVGSRRGERGIDVGVPEDQKRPSKLIHHEDPDHVQRYGAVPILRL